MSTLATRNFNATRPHHSNTYPTKIIVNRHEGEVYHLTLNYLTGQDARIAANELGVEADDDIVHLFTRIIYWGDLIEALQATFSCHYVEYH